MRYRELVSAALLGEWKRNVFGFISFVDKVNLATVKRFESLRFENYIREWIRSGEEQTETALETSASESLYGGQIT